MRRSSTYKDDFILLGMAGNILFIARENRVQLNTPPWGTPWSILCLLDTVEPILV